MWSGHTQAPVNCGFLGSPTPHSCEWLKGLQPVENSGVSAPWGARLARNGFDLFDRLTFHLQIRFKIPIRRGQAGMPQEMADRRESGARFQKGNGRTMAPMSLKT